MIRGQDLMELYESEPRIAYVMMRNLSRIIGERFRALQEGSGPPGPATT